MANDRITAAIIIYNKSICDSITFQSIKDIDLDILILDNSENDYCNKRFCANRGIRYISMGGNKGLSKAYNRAIENSTNSDVIILFDDDTEVKRDYFVKLKEALDKEKDVDIFAPIIRGQDGVIYSPNEFSFLRNHLIKSPNHEVSQKSFNAIGSCLAIRMRVFDDYYFNEKLFMDQVDQYFFYEQRKIGRRFGKLDVEILQHFYQRETTLSSDAGWKRLKMRIYDIFRQARLMEKKKYVFLAFVKSCGLGAQIGLKSKSPFLTLKAFYLGILLVFYDI